MRVYRRGYPALTGLGAVVALLGLAAASAPAAPIEGYAWPPSVPQGGTVGIYVSSSQSPISITVFRQGATQVLYGTYAGLPGVVQAVPESAWAYGCGWSPTLQLVVPESWPSGVYLAKFAGPGFSGTYAVFTVREDNPGSTAGILIQNSINTWEAYNPWGGKSLYEYNSSGGVRGNQVSFQRPYSTWSGKGQFPDFELQFVQWIEAAGYPVEYCTDVDTHRDPGLLSHYALFLVVGHDEYWSREMRDNVNARLAARKNVAVFAGNTCWWQIRYSPDLSRIICYKDRNLDPYFGVDNPRVTVNWTSYPVNDPENPVLGVSYLNGGFVNSNGWYPASEGYGDYTAYRTNHWVFAGTGLTDGQEFGYAEGLVGFETDGALFSMKNNLPIVTGADGGPISYKVLGVSPASRGYATMGIFKRGGTLFNAATTGWSLGLASDPVVQRITRNVIEALAGISQALPAVEPPVILAPNDLTTAGGASVALPVAAMDPELGSLTFLATGLPPGLAVNPATGTISGIVPPWGVRAEPYQPVLSAVGGAVPPETTSVTWNWTISGQIGVGDELSAGLAPRLFAPEPNPVARGGTRVRFETAVAGSVTVAIRDVQGRTVREVEQEDLLPAGTHETRWDGTDASGRAVAPGVYVLDLVTGGIRRSEPLVVLRR